MAARISAEFETPDLAEFALKRVKSSLEGIHSTNLIYNRSSERAMKLQNGSIYTIIPTAVTSYNYLTAVMESPAAIDVIKEPYRSQKTIINVICEEESVNNVKSILGAMGGLKVTQS